ncbi:MAG: hypothetical protein AB7T31_15490 [Gemmatimonadales bacterium]
MKRLSVVLAWRWLATGIVAIVVGACGDADDTGGGMGDMPGMGPDAAEVASADPMQAHLERMSVLPADSLIAVLPLHRQMVANMLARMNREMAGMNMTSDASWNASVDSIRSDLAGMPTMGVSTLAGLMPGHLARVGRLMTMHAAMMRM